MALGTGAAILGAGSLLLSAGQMGMGIAQMFGKKPDQPKYEIPESAKRALALQQRQAGDPTIAGESLIQQQMETSGATAIETAKRSGSASNVFDVLQSQQQAQSQGILQMAMARAQERQRRQAQYGQALERFGQYEDKKWEWEVGKPYIDKTNQYQANKQAGFSNIMSGVQGALNTGASMAQSSAMNERYQMLYGDRYPRTDGVAMMTGRTGLEGSTTIPEGLLTTGGYAPTGSGLGVDGLQDAMLPSDLFNVGTMPLAAGIAGAGSINPMLNNPYSPVMRY